MTVPTAARVCTHSRAFSCSGVLPHPAANLQARIVLGLWASALLFLLGAISAAAQTPEMQVPQAQPLPVQAQQAALTPLALPEAPAPVPQQTLQGNQPLSASYTSSSAVSQRNTSLVAPLYAKTIPPGYTAQPLSPHQEIDLGLHDLYTPLSLSGIVIAAGYSHLTNGQPNYGTDRGAFGERLGAAFLRDTTEGLFSDVLLAPRMHEDTRYYVEGPQHNVAHRLVYALSRTLVTRTSDGSESVNGSLLLGYAGAAALTNAYYPPLNRNFHDTLATYGASLGGASLGNVVHEFAGDLLTAVHLKKKTNGVQ